MKNLTIAFLALIALSSCDNKNSVLISGKILNPVDKNVLIYEGYSMTTDTIRVNPDGTFSKSISVSDEHLGLIKHGNFYIPLNLKPESEIAIDFDTEDIKNYDFTKVAFSGKGSETSTFLVNISNLIRNAVSDSAYNLKPDEFQIIAENDFRKIENTVTDYYSNNPKENLFVEKVQFMILSEKTNCFFKYIRNNAEENDTSALIKSFMQIVDNLPKDNETYAKEISEYRRFLISYYETTIKNRLQEEQIERFTIKYMNRNIDEVALLSTEQSIKDAIGNKILTVYSLLEDSIQQIVSKRYKELVKNPQYLGEFEKTVSILERLKPGSVPPDFTLTDINGTSISLSALKGNVVYLDFWHTKCGPCIYDMPFAKILEEKLKGMPVVFLSISIDDTKSEWEKFVKEKELVGIQIYAPNGKNAEIAKEYAVKAIPTYIIIDKDGKIAEYSSSRPSDEETEKKLLQLAMK